jgi:hypothetical protein
MCIDRSSKEKLSVERQSVKPRSEVPVFEEELPDARCIDLEYLLLSLPPSHWVITVQERNTSLGEDLGEECLEATVGASVGGTTRVGKFTGRRRL